MFIWNLSSQLCFIIATYPSSYLYISYIQSKTYRQKIKNCGKKNSYQLCKAIHCPIFVPYIVCVSTHSQTDVTSLKYVLPFPNFILLIYLYNAFFFCLKILLIIIEILKLWHGEAIDDWETGVVVSETQMTRPLSHGTRLPIYLYHLSLFCFFRISIQWLAVATNYLIIYSASGWIRHKLS